MSDSKMFVPGAALDGLRLALEAENKKLRAEIENLRDRVEVLREPLAVYVHAHQTGNSVPPHIEAAARAALEAKP
jgi:cell division protein FtsB